MGASSAFTSKAWMTLAITSVASLAVALVGITILAVLLADVPEAQTLLKKIETCSKRCNRCYTCLEKYADQDLSRCRGDVPSIIYECIEQINFLYSRNKPPKSTESSIPCFSRCTRCRKCLKRLNLIIPTLNHTLWESVYTDVFFEESILPIVDPDDDKGDDDSSDSDSRRRRRRSSAVVSSNTTLVRHKRQILDGDACCQTQRWSQPYLTSIVDTFGQTWHAVWFFDQFAFPQFRYQITDVITCPRVSSCDPTIECRLHSEPRTLLFTRQAPQFETGHSYIFLLYPSTTTKFIDVALPCYCKCVN